MRTSLRKLAFVLAPPMLSAGLLAGIVVQQGRHLTPADVEPYHVRVKTAIDSIPYIIGEWTGQNNPVMPAAQKLLRPNAILSRLYSDNSTATTRRPRAAQLLIVQCRDSRDMIGHYPPICYRAQGKTLDGRFSGPRDWQVGGMAIPGYEYQFTEMQEGQITRVTVYNFLIVPGRGIVRDMKGVEQAAEDYQQRYYGAAQFQVVFRGQASAERSRESRVERDAIFATLMGPNIKLIETLTSGGLK
jgi:hypothetical protein